MRCYALALAALNVRVARLRIAAPCLALLASTTAPMAVRRINLLLGMPTAGKSAESVSLLHGTQQREQDAAQGGNPHRVGAAREHRLRSAEGMGPYGEFSMSTFQV